MGKNKKDARGVRQGLRKGGELALGVEKASGVESGVEKRFRRDEHQLCLLRGAVCQSSVSHIADPEAVHTHERSARSFFFAHTHARANTRTHRVKTTRAAAVSYHGLVTTLPLQGPLHAEEDVHGG